MYGPLCVCFRALKGRGLFIHKNCHRGKPCLTVKAVRSKTSNSVSAPAAACLKLHIWCQLANGPLRGLETSKNCRRTLDEYTLGLNIQYVFLRVWYEKKIHSCH